MAPVALAAVASSLIAAAAIADYTDYQESQKMYSTLTY